MPFLSTDIRDLAAKVALAVVAAIDASDDPSGDVAADIRDIHIFLQQQGTHNEWDNGEVVQYPLCSVHCDQSWGGTDAAEAAVRERLPSRLYILSNTPHQAWGKIAEEQGYAPVDFALGVSLAVEQLL